MKEESHINKRRHLVGLLCMLLMIWIVPVKAQAAQAWAVIDADTGRLLLGENEETKLPIASLTKIWTAFTVMESGVPLGETTMSPEAAMSEGSSIYLPQGTKVQVESLLYGLMLRSGNDAAYALAEHAGGSVEGFVQLMNEKAVIYGLENTTFTNPSGLHDDAHLSTAYDTALMMRYAMENEQFKKIASTKNYTLKLPKETYHWQNKHRLLHSNPQAIAGKTGFTKTAGRTLVTYFEQDDKRIIVVTLNDGNDWQTHEALAAQIFSEYNKEMIARKGRYQFSPTVIGTLAAPIHVLLKDGEQTQLQHRAHLSRTSATGEWLVYLNGEPIVTRSITIEE